MKKPIYVTLSAALLLTSCTQQLVETTPNTDPQPKPTANTEIPFIPRSIANTYTCPTTTGHTGLAALLKEDALDQGNFVSRLQAQTDLPGTVQDMLYSSKSLLNNVYYGFSPVDLQQHHENAYQAFKKVYPKLLAEYSVDSKTDKLMYPYIEGIEDHHTYYMDANSYDYYQKTRTNTTVPTPTFGINTTTVPNGDGILILNVRAEGSGFAAGLRRGDVLLSIDGQELKRTVAATQNADGSVDDSKQAAIYSKILAEAAAKKTPVDVKVRRGTAVRTVQLTGEILKATQFPWGEIRSDTTTGQNYYYLRIPTFGGDGIASKVHALVAEANAKNVTGMVVDLRNNGGGLVREYVGAVAAFVPEKAGQTLRFVDASETVFAYDNGNVMYSWTCSKPASTLKVEAPTQWKGKVAVLINASSASASEMFSQNIKQGNLALLIGEKTYGVGNTSTFVFELPAKRGISVTAGRVSVGGKAATEKVTPDIQVADNKVSLAATGVDDALQTALAELRK